MKLQKCFYFFHDLPYYLFYLSKNELTKTFLLNNYNRVQAMIYQNLYLFLII